MFCDIVFRYGRFVVLRFLGFGEGFIFRVYFFSFEARFLICGRGFMNWGVVAVFYRFIDLNGSSGEVGW